MTEYEIENEGHTVGCLLRQRLFDNQADFAACVVKHPQDTNLFIRVQAPDPKACILSAISDAELAIDRMLQSVKAFQIHMEVDS